MSIEVNDCRVEADSHLGITPVVWTKWHWVAGFGSAFVLPWLWVSIGLTAYAIQTQAWVIMLLLLPVWPVTGLFYLRYDVRAFRYLTMHKTLGDTVGFTAEPRTGRVLGIFVLGNLLVLLSLGLVSGTFLLALGVVLEVLNPGFDPMQASVLSWSAILAGLVSYFTFFVLWDVLRQVFVRVPLLAHYAETIGLQNPHGLAELDQRARDEMEHAEGFAEALDVGAAL